MFFSLSPFAPENLVSRDGCGGPVPRQPAHLHSQAESGDNSRDSSRVPRRRPFSFTNHHTPSGQSRVNRVTQLRTDGVHCRESTGTGPVVPKVVPVTSAALAGHHGPINMRLSFSHLLLEYYWYKVVIACWKYKHTYIVIAHLSMRANTKARFIGMVCTSLRSTSCSDQCRHARISVKLMCWLLNAFLPRS